MENVFFLNESPLRFLYSIYLDIYLFCIRSENQSALRLPNT
jgi:hypothetical protein